MMPYYPKTTQFAVAIWLLVCAIMIFIMVVLGGMTRLTHSGLSIVDWRPITGFLPPMTELAWQEMFKKYQQYQEFEIKNPNMDLAGFKSIFWLEFIHRLWGRMIGLVFLIPFVFFLCTRRLDGKTTVKLVATFFLGALQGILGWLMVKSGLSDSPNVSQYHLTAHLILAFILYGYLFWTALQLLFPKPHSFERYSMRPYQYATSILILLLAVTVMSGGLVAGTDAGFIYNTFPLMGETFLPKDLFVFDSLAKNFFENIVMIQFVHRLLTMLTFFAIGYLYFEAINQVLPRRTRIALRCLLVAAILQMALGISTLLLSVPIPLAVLHQASALTLWTILIWVKHEFRG